MDGAVTGPPAGSAAAVSPVEAGTQAGPASEPGTAELLARVEELTRRVEWLEASLADGQPPPPAESPDVVLAISAAVAAYLGKRATVRQVHVRSHSTWAKQGRAHMMASHGFTHGGR